MRYDVHEIGNALNSKSNGLGQHFANCPICQDTPAEQRKGRKLSIKQGRNGKPLLYCFRGCRYEDIRDYINNLMQGRSDLNNTPRVFTHQANIQDEENERRQQVLQCISENAQDGQDVPAVRNYAKLLGFTRIPASWFYSERILGHEGLAIPEPSKPSLIIMCRDSAGKPAGGQRILIYDNGERITNYAKVKYSKFTFGFVRGNPYRTTMYSDATTRALMVTESAETAAVLHEATNGGEAWAVLGVTNFMTIPLRDPPIPLTRPIFFFPDMDEVSSAAYKAFQRAVAQHEHNGYTCFQITPPEAIGSGNNFTDTCKREGIESVRSYLNKEITQIKRDIQGH